MAAALAGRIRQVVTYPHPVLRQKAVPVAFDGVVIDPQAAQLAADLTATMRVEQGLGLAAPQVNESVRMFAMMWPTFGSAVKPLSAATPSAPPVTVSKGRSRGAAAKEWARRASDTMFRREPAYRVVVNPEIVDKSADLATGLEGCLSVPEYNALIRRSLFIDVRYRGVGGEEYFERFSGLPAVVFQHEYDHLDGVIHTDREKQAYSGDNRAELVSAAHDRYIADLYKYFNIRVRSGSIAPDDF